MNKTAEFLQKARLEIETKGLYKGALEDHTKGPEGPCCMMGALCRAAGKAVNTKPIQDLFAKAMDTLETVLPYNNVPIFNDSKSTTKKTALKKFDEAISLALCEEV